MEDWLWGLLAVVLIVGVIRPLFWLVALSVSLWIGRLFLNDHFGKFVFGHYWKSAAPEIPEQTKINGSNGKRDCAIAEQASAYPARGRGSK